MHRNAVTLLQKPRHEECESRPDNSSFELVRRKGLLLKGKNNTSVDVPYSRNKVVAFVAGSPSLSKPAQQAIIEDIQELSDEAIMNLYTRITSDIESAITLMWEKKLEEFLKSAPPKYETDKGDRTPMRFLEDVWGKFMDHRVLYQDTLSDYDNKLIPAIYRHWNRYGRSQDDRLPEPRQKRTEAILQRVAAYTPYTVEEITRAVRALDRRQGRAHERSGEGQSRSR